jgi:hypothetical protein
MNLDKIGRVFVLIGEFERRANEVLATHDGAFFGTKATGALRRNQHGTHEGARRPAEAWVS